MKKTILFISMFAGLCEFAVTAQDTSYLNAAWQDTTAAKAVYVRIKKKTDDGWQVSECLRSGKLIMTGSYIDDSLHIGQGEFSWYTAKGVLSRRNNYTHGKLEGAETYYYENGRKRATGQYKDNENDGEWIGYYPSGKISGKATYDKGKQVAASFFDEEGTPNKKQKIFMQESAFPGGPAKFLQYLNKHVKYPDVAVTKKIEGTVVVQFKVLKDGTIAEISVAKSVDKSLDNEALRVLREMPDWEPALLAGVPIESYKKTADRTQTGNC